MTKVAKTKKPTKTSSRKPPKKTGPKKYTRVDEEELRKVQSSYEYWSPHVLGEEPSNWEKRKFFIFREIGDSIEGFLGPGIVNYRRNKSYPVQLSNGDVYEIFGNRWLHRIIEDNELVGSIVRITYVGLRRVYGHARSQKIYDVEKVTFGDVTIQTPKDKKTRSKKRKEKR